MKNNSHISNVKNLISASKALLLISFILLASHNAIASDIINGKKLYTARCQGCHDNKIHTRPNRIIHTYDDLVGRVKFCDGAAKSNFTDTEIVDVIDYLNDAFYKFIKEP